MAIEKDFGLERGRAPTSDALLKLVNKPTEDLIQEFGERFEEEKIRSDGTSDRLPTENGKFVATHGFLLIAPYPRLVAHDDIRKARPDLSEEMAASLREADELGIKRLESYYSRELTNLTDAGWFSIDPDASAIKIFGESGDFFRADAEGRERTVEAFRRALGSIPVKNLDQLA